MHTWCVKLCFGFMLCACKRAMPWHVAFHLADQQELQNTLARECDGHNLATSSSPHPAAHHQTLNKVVWIMMAGMKMCTVLAALLVATGVTGQ